eukprot:2025683-Pyramimonas_sp.AAC.1
MGVCVLAGSSLARGCVRDSERKSLSSENRDKMPKGLRSHVHSAQGERGRDETSIRQVSVKQDYSIRNV